MKNLKRHLFIAVFFFVHSSFFAQELLKERVVGVNFEFSVISEKLPDGSYYTPFLPLVNYGFSLFRKTKKSNLFLYFEPQINPVWLVDRERGQSELEFETGLNVGFKYTYKIKPKLSAFAGIGSGPHYISTDTALQAGGFVFSNNFFGGLRFELKKQFFISFRYQFRHISNAGLKYPNFGIDNHYVVLGASKSF